MKKIKIGFVVNDLVVGGVAKVLISLSNNLNPELFDIHLLVLSNNIEMLKYLPLKNNVTLHCFEYRFDTNYSLISYLKNSFNYSSTFEKSVELRKTIQTLQLEILHFHTLPRQLVIGILAKKKNNRLKLIFTDHSNRIIPGDYNFYQHYLLAFSYR
ncbi:MAG: hypothetical protein JKY48_10800 [Flavobacteriales bacterium]|nr:hypothetical protein [Flavobacteriales bacterium]